MRLKAHIHNPVLALPSAQRIQDLPKEARDALKAVLLDLRAESAEKAQVEWKRNKGMTAAYWKAVSIYALHISRLCRDEIGPRNGRDLRVRAPMSQMKPSDNAGISETFL